MSETNTDESLDNSDQKSDVTPIIEAPQDANSESTQHSTNTRRLRRINKAPEDVRSARQAELTKKRSAGARKRVKKPEDFLGVDLADGRYTVKSQLGKGSMAYVFLAADKRLETDVVVKVPKPEIITTKDFRERFKRETQLLVKFSHPHVVSVLDIGEFEELPFVVMQLLSGGSFADQMKAKSNDKGQMPAESLKGWLPGVARALDFCYRKGMVHRDVKPANILFDEDDNPFVADFGLSKVMYGDHVDTNSAETAAGIVLGTPNYICPEIVLAKGYDGRADQYSLGITVYHALLGRAPMQGNSATATMVNQTQKHLQLLSDIRSDVPLPLAKAIQKSIEKNPDNRFETCEAFAEAVLESFRSPTSSGSMAAPSVTVTPATDSKGSSPSSKSAKHKSPRRKNRSSGSGQRTAPASHDDSDWLDVAIDSPMPPRKGNAGAAKAKKSKQAKKRKPTAALKMFGKDVPLPAAAGGLTLVVAFLFAVITMFSAEHQPEVTNYARNPGRLAAAPNDASGNGSRSSKPKAVAASGARKPGAANGSNAAGKKNNRSGKNRNRNQQKAPSSNSIPTVVANAKPRKNIWKYIQPNHNNWGKNAENGIELDVLTLPKGLAGDSDGFQVIINADDANTNWAQVSIKGADFSRDSRFPHASSGLTVADLNRLEIEFDYDVPGNMAVGIYIESGPFNGNWTDRSLKIDDDSIRRNPTVDGHAVVKLAKSKIPSDKRQLFVDVLNSDAQRSDILLKFGIKGRQREKMPSGTFIIRNVVMRLR